MFAFRSFKFKKASLALNRKPKFPTRFPIRVIEADELEAEGWIAADKSGDTVAAGVGVAIKISCEIDEELGAIPPGAGMANGALVGTGETGVEDEAPGLPRI
jgi:hypothetical protein